MRTFLSVVSLGIVYLIFLASESFTRFRLEKYFNQNYISEELIHLLPYLVGYIAVLWLSLVAYLGWLIYKKEEDNNKFITLAMVVCFIAIPLTAFVSPFFRVLF